jgi:hypothetical protein
VVPGGAVTALTAYVMRKNETMLLVGHADGTVNWHMLGEQMHTESMLPEDLCAPTPVDHQPHPIHCVKPLNAWLFSFEM